MTRLAYHAAIAACVIDYARLNYQWRAHHARFKRRVEAMPRKLICQDCRGEGGYTESIMEDGSGPSYDCGWCEGTGLVTPWRRAEWLRFRREEKREELQRGYKFPRGV